VQVNSKGSSVLLEVCSTISQQPKADADTKKQSPTQSTGRRRVRNTLPSSNNRKQNKLKKWGLLTTTTKKQQI
jgi:hypothetical protein